MTNLTRLAAFSAPMVYEGTANIELSPPKLH
jgi:hypothetical protein